MKHRILVVEDESIVALDLQTRLENYGFDVISIESNGSRAVEKALSECPDLILMDINLKGSLDGIETASLIKRHLDSPVIFLTAFADDKTLNRAKVSDASGYILKPFQEGELLTTIELAIKRDSIKKKIQENSKWLYNTLNTVNDAVITLSNENRVIFINDNAKKIINSTIEKGQIFNPKAQIVTEGERTFYFAEGEKTLYVTENNKIDIEYFQTEIEDENHVQLGTVHFIRDISKQVEYEIGLERARVAAENSKRAKNEFLANITHELRTPLNTIMGMNSLISELSEDQEISTMHNLINNAAVDLLKQLNEILELSEIESGKLHLIDTRFSTDKLISDVLEPFQSQINLKNLQVSILNEDKIPFLDGDKNKIKDILSCLISNAVKFSKNDTISIIPELIDNNLTISVEDSGIGLTEEQKKLIFGLFTQVDGSSTRVYGGTGLGLTLVSKLLELMNGAIDVKSEYGKGSKFTFSIPVKISDDQNSKLKLEEPESITEYIVPDLNLPEYRKLKELMNDVNRLVKVENFTEIGILLKRYNKEHILSDLNIETQLIFQIAIAAKTNNKIRLNGILDTVLQKNNRSTGDVI